MFTITMALFIFVWCLIIYHHLVYPFFLQQVLQRPGLLSALRKSTRLKQSDTPDERSNKSKNNHSGSSDNQYPTTMPLDDQRPKICILIPAYNEAAVIAEKIRNLACLNYPANKYKVVIACDGCTDKTAAVARDCAKELENEQLDLTVVELPENRGKVFVINFMVSCLNDQIIALSDASALISIDALNIAANHFSNNSVAIVAASYQILRSGSTGENSYWQYQSNIKRGEAMLGDPIGVHGALYLFRRSVFKPLAWDTINDDFILPMNMVSEGHHAIYDPTIVALELEQASRQMDQKRRVRLAAGNLQQLLRLPKLLAPKLGWTAFNYFSGKALRTVMPLLILIQLTLCLLLASQFELLAIFAVLQICGFCSAWLSNLLPQRWLPRYLNIIFYIANGYRCSLLGLIRYALGLERGCWKPVARHCDHHCDNH